jgi:hypothetical protein
LGFYRLSGRFCARPYRTTGKSSVALLSYLNFYPLLSALTSHSGVENGSFSGTLDRGDPSLQLRMDSRAADSLFSGADDDHDFFTSLDGANTSPKQSVQQPAVEYAHSALADPILLCRTRRHPQRRPLQQITRRTHMHRQQAMHRQHQATIHTRLLMRLTPQMSTNRLGALLPSSQRPRTLHTPPLVCKIQYIDNSDIWLTLLQPPRPR